MSIDNLLNNKFLRIIGSVTALVSAYSCESGNGNDDKQNQGCVNCGDTNIGQNNPSNDTTEYNRPANDTTAPVNYHNLLDPCDPLKIESVCLSPQNMGKCTLESGGYLITKYGDCNDPLTPCYEYEEGGYQKAACACTPGTIACCTPEIVACEGNMHGKRKCLDVGEGGNYKAFPSWIGEDNFMRNYLRYNRLACEVEICPFVNYYPADNCIVECDDTSGEATCRCTNHGEEFGFDCYGGGSATQTWYKCLDDGTIEELSCECANDGYGSNAYCDSTSCHYGCK